MSDTHETLLDAVKLSRAFHSQNLLGFTSHQVPYKHYEIADDGTTSEIEKAFAFEYVQFQQLLAHVRAERNVNISFHRYDGTTTTNVIAMTYAVDESHYAIIYDGNATECKKRFAFVKELIHIFIGAVEELMTPDTLEKVLLTASMCRRDPPLGRKMSPEDFCYFCAIEILIPYGDKGAYREKFTNLHGKLCMPSYTIAYAVKVPMTVVQYFFECDSKYAQQSMSANMNL